MDIHAKVVFASVGEAEEAQDKALQVRNSYPEGSPQWKVWDSIYGSLFSIYERLWEGWESRPDPHGSGEPPGLVERHGYTDLGNKILIG